MLATVGLYSNYRLVLNALNNLLNKVATAFSGSVGNFAALENSDRLYRVYKEMDFLFFVQSGYLTGGLMMLFNPLDRPAVWQGILCFPMTTVTIIVVEFYSRARGLRQTNLLSREVMATVLERSADKACADESAIDLVDLPCAGAARYRRDRHYRGHSSSARCAPVLGSPATSF